jgi:hypothetical protein
MGTKKFPIMPLTVEVLRSGNQEYLPVRKIAGETGPAILQKCGMTDWQVKKWSDQPI